MLKQSAFFKKIKRKNLTVSKYYVLYQLYQKPKLSKLGIQTIHQKHQDLETYLNDDCTLNDKGVKLVESMDLLFKPQKQLKALDVLGEGFEEKVQEYIELFPTGKLPNNKYARGNKKEITENLKWFFQEYHYDWDVILGATEMYIEEYRRKNYEYMRTAMFFIKKLIAGTITSDLATYCEAYLAGDQAPKIVHKRKVV